MALPLALIMAFALAMPAFAFKTSDPALITLNVPGIVAPIISVGEVVDGVKFEGLPDGIGIVDGPSAGTATVFVANEQTTVPFFGSRDFSDASVTSWTIDTATGDVIGAAEPLPASAGFLRFCSAAIAGPNEGFSTPVFFVNEETNDIVDVPAGAPYGADPALAPQRQGGYSVILNTETGEFTQVAGLGRLNHENTVGLPGYNQIALLTTDDTFSATTSQLYMYLANNESQVWQDKGSLWAFQVTRKNGVAVDQYDPFNGANDYLDLGLDDEMQGKFIRVPKEIARGTTGEAPQDALENWSVANNVFTFVRLEDVAVDKNNGHVVYVADTGASRVVPDPATGRLWRPSGTGLADNGRIFKFVFNDKNPKKVDSFTVLADGDAPTHPKFVGFTSPDNLDTSSNSLMVQEDADNAQIWQHKFSDGSWTAVADVVDTGGESSGIVDASAWFGAGSWLLDVQAHDLPYVDVDTTSIPGTTIKREEGQLLWINIPGS
ncbi:MAG TPA: hypothetical protein VK838_05790 [Candidatus Limnocylindrales bacterium]|nr:hypothetical protein [Candidatus Limnocylindrales bacterium]